MNVILVSPLPPPAGGITSWTQHFLESDEAKKNNVTVVNCSVTGVRVNRPMDRRFKDEVLRGMRIKKEIRDLLKSGNYEVIHYNSSCSMMGMAKDYLCLRQAKGKVKIIIQYHCDTGDMVRGNISEFLFRRLSRLADEVFCLNTQSEHYLEQVAKRTGRIIPNYITLNPGNQKTTLSDEIRTVVYVGHVLISKGYIEMMQVAKEYPGINFKLIGACRTDFEYIKPVNVEYLGELDRDEVFCHLKTADLFLFPSHSEGFPMAVLEAMSCGLPIIATGVGAIPDMIEDKGGILVKLGDVGAMINAIAELQDPGKRRKMSIWNIGKVQRAYSTDKVVKRMFELYKR